MPDVVTPTMPEHLAIEPVPDASPGEILGLLEYLDARGGSDDLFRIVTDTHKDFGRVITIVKAAEILDFVDTPKRLVALAADGRRLLTAAPGERKSIWREQLLKLRLFRDLNGVIERQPGHQVERDFVLETLALALPGENLERTFDTVCGWSQAGDLFEYDDERGRLVRPGS